jgi:hypothetical protein
LSNTGNYDPLPTITAPAWKDRAGSFRAGRPLASRAMVHDLLPANPCSGAVGLSGETQAWWDDPTNV